MRERERSANQNCGTENLLPVKGENISEFPRTKDGGNLKNAEVVDSIHLYIQSRKAEETKYQQAADRKRKEERGRKNFCHGLFCHDQNIINTKLILFTYCFSKYNCLLKSEKEFLVTAEVGRN